MIHPQVAQVLKRSASSKYPSGGFKSGSEDRFKQQRKPKVPLVKASSTREGTRSGPGGKKLTKQNSQGGK
jgi:hypothetical protein